MPVIGPDPSTIASPAAAGGPPDLPGSQGLSGQDAAPSPDLSPGEGAAPPVATAGAQQPGPQPGAMAQMRGLAGIGLHFLDLAVRLGPGGDERDFLMNHVHALSKRFKRQSPPGQDLSSAQLPLVPGPGGGGPPPMGPGSTAQPATPNLPRGPMPSPSGAGMMPG